MPVKSSKLQVSYCRRQRQQVIMLHDLLGHRLHPRHHHRHRCFHHTWNLYHHRDHHHNNQHPNQLRMEYLHLQDPKSQLLLPALQHQLARPRMLIR